MACSPKLTVRVEDAIARKAISPGTVQQKRKKVREFGKELKLTQLTIKLKLQHEAERIHTHFSLGVLTEGRSSAHVDPQVILRCCQFPQRPLCVRVCHFL